MNDWYGTVTVDNIEEIAEQLRQLLAGKYFTTVHCYEYRDWRPEVRLRQYLQGNRESRYSGDPANITLIHHHLKPDAKPNATPHSQIVIGDSYGVGGFATTRTDPGYDPEYNSPYVHIEWNKVTITNRAPNGLKYHVVYAVEGDISDTE